MVGASNRVPKVTACHHWGAHQRTLFLRLSSNLTLTRAGFFIYTCGYLAASPDGIVMDTDGHPVRLVEVKCPFSTKDKTVEQACNENKDFCFSLDENKPYLKFCCLDPKRYFYTNNPL